MRRCDCTPLLVQACNVRRRLKVLRLAIHTYPATLPSRAHNTLLGGVSLDISLPSQPSNSTHNPTRWTLASSKLTMVSLGEAIYENAHKFIPERWYKSSTSVKEKSAYAPFSAGPYNCIGKPLALMNLRTTAAKLLHRFDVCLADGENGTAFERDMKTQFTAAMGALNLKFTERKVGGLK